MIHHCIKKRWRKFKNKYSRHQRLTNKITILFQLSRIIFNQCPKLRATQSSNPYGHDIFNNWNTDAP